MLRTKNHYAGLDYILDEAHSPIRPGKGKDYYAQAGTVGGLA
ncbi:MAG: hypothetical protein U0798_05840 [Gemmataceae bacterium]